MREGLKDILTYSGVDMSAYEQELFNYRRLRRQLDAEATSCAETDFASLLCERSSANPIVSLFRNYLTETGSLLSTACSIGVEALQRFNTGARRAAYKSEEH